MPGKDSERQQAVGSRQREKAIGRREKAEGSGSGKRRGS